MDDVPPSPTSHAPRRPALSVVIPVHNGGDGFERCLLRLHEARGVDFELIVVDDGSTDHSAALAARFGARILTNARPVGPASARNDGAVAASTPLVFFLDADVAPHPDALARAVDRFAADPGLTALFGSYDDEPDAPGLVSRFRNLLHHFTHQQGAFLDDARTARTFWTGCGAIRRDAFLAIGGFDPRLYARPAIEDIELGYRLTRSGHKIVLARDVQGTHLKRWTLRSMIHTDIFQRGVPWLLLMKRSGVVETDLNVRPGQKACVAATGLGALAALLSPFWPRAALIAAAAPVLIVALNPSLYRFLARKRGTAFALGSIPLHMIYYACCGASVAIALGYWRFTSARRVLGSAVAGPMGLRARREARDRARAASRRGD